MKRRCLGLLLCVAALVLPGCDEEDWENLAPLARFLERVDAHDILAVREINLFPIVGR